MATKPRLTTLHHPTLPGISKRVSAKAASRWRAAGWVTTEPPAAPAGEDDRETDKKEN